METTVRSENGHQDATLPYGKGDTFTAIGGLLAAALAFASVIWGDKGHDRLAIGVLMLGVGLGSITALRGRFLRPLRWMVITACAVYAYQLVASWL